MPLFDRVKISLMFIYRIRRLLNLKLVSSNQHSSTLCIKLNLLVKARVRCRQGTALGREGNILRSGVLSLQEREKSISCISDEIWYLYSCFFFRKSKQYDVK